MFAPRSIAVTAFAWSPDGVHCAAATSDLHIAVSSREDSAWRGRQLDPQTRIKQLCWSPDSTKLALVFHSGQDLWIWNLAKDQIQKQGLRAARSAAWARNGRLVHAVLSEDRGLRWDISTQEQQLVQSTFFHDVAAMERSPVEDLFAMVSPSSPEIRLWTSFSDMRSILLEAPMQGLAWSPDGKTLAVFGETAPNIELISVAQARRVGVLEGHLDPIRSCEFSPDGKFLVSSALDNTIRVWRSDTLKLVAQHVWPVERDLPPVRLHPHQPRLTALSANREQLQFLDVFPPEQDRGLPPTVRHVSAKLVLAGEPRVGKTCLALRLAEDRYEEQESTHGMHFWSLSPERLAPAAAAPPGERREVVLWDLGGQEEYRLVHQLFLHDTTVALVLLDPVQGQAAFDAVEAWTQRFDKQLHGRAVVKLLVGTKQDADVHVDKLGLEALVKRCGFAGYFATSAKNGRGLSELKAAIARALDWPSLVATSRPDLFQRIQDEIALRRGRGEVVLPMADLERTIREQSPADYEERAVAAVVRQLALQGVIARTRLATGDEVLVLQLGEVERYAGSLILAARDNPLGVPAIEQARITRRDWELPRIPSEERLPFREERWVLECVVELLIEHGVCVQHEGLLVFPTLFRTTESRGVQVSRPASASYSFAGAVDNIYSSLVASVVLSGHFGQMRLWEDRAEFGSGDRGMSGLLRTDRPDGSTRLDVYFDERTSPESQSLFKRFVEDHLRRRGVWLSIQPGVVSEPSEAGLFLEHETRRLRETIAEQTRSAVEQAKHLLGEPSRVGASEEPLRVLHLSDLHMRSSGDVEELLQPLIADLRDAQEGLGVRELDYLVISGDLTERALPEEFEQARRFISGLIKEFKLTAQRCIIVPGNHDLSWDEEGLYEFRMKRQVKPEQLKPGHHVEKEGWVLLRNEERYPLRFRNFSKFLYHPLMQQEYPLEPHEQGLVSTFLESGLQFLAFNSAWEADEHFPHRAHLHSGAIARALRLADEQLAVARAQGKPAPGRSVLRVAVWHHPPSGAEMMSDPALLERLRQKDVRLCLHGHVHEDRAELMHYLHPTRKLHVVGAGSMGAPARDRPESTPRLYNLMEIARTGNKARVHTRCRRREGGAWEGWAVWWGPSPTERRTYYDIVLAPVEQA